MEPRPGKNWPVRTAHWRKNQPNMCLQGLVELSTIFYGNTRDYERWPETLAGLHLLAFVVLMLHRFTFVMAHSP